MGAAMKKIKWSSILLTMCALAVVIGIASLTARGKKTKEKLVLGDWYRQWSESLSFTLYDDGTANIAGTDRMGKWSLVNDDQLILTDADGKATILKIEGIDADNMEVREIVDGQESEKAVTFWHTAEGAQTIRVKGYY